MLYIRTQNNPDLGRYSSNQITAIEGILYIYDGNAYNNEYGIYLDSPLCLVKLGIYPSLERAEDVFEMIADCISSGKRYFEMPSKNLRTVNIQRVK